MRGSVNATMATSGEPSQLVGQQSYTNSGVRWHVVAFRAVRDGELEIIQALCEQQPVLLHDRFTREMEDWELEYESLKWYQFRDTTCLFIACAYCQRAVVARVRPASSRLGGAAVPYAFLVS